MSLRNRVNKLIENRKSSQKRNFFIIAQSKEQELRDIQKIQDEFKGDLSLLLITVFRIYEQSTVANI